MNGPKQLNVKCKKGDCTKCETCIYDAPLDTPLKNISKMRDNFGIMSVNNNPATAQIVFMNGKGPLKESKPFEHNNDYILPAPLIGNNNQQKASNYCNSCEFLDSIQRPGQSTFNCRCKLAKVVGSGNVSRVIKLKVYNGEKIQKPWWCPSGNEAVRRNLGLKPTTQLMLPLKETNSAMSDSQRERWETSRRENERREKWYAIPGLTSWEEIEVGKVYHLPPTWRKGRANIEIKTKNPASIFAVDIYTKDNVWLYKCEEEYKFLSEIKKK